VWQRKMSANIKTPTDEKLQIYSPRAEVGVKEPCFSAGKDKPNLTD